MELVVLEQGVVGLEEDIRTVLILCSLGLVAFHHTPLKGHRTHLSFTEAPHLKMGTQRIHRFHTHTVQTHTLLERLRVVLTTRIEYAHRLHEFSLRDATAIVAYGHTQVILDIDLYALAGIHLELVDGVVDHLLQQHVDTIFRQGAIAQTTDIHSWTGPYMFHIRQMTDILIGILNLFVFYDDVFFHDHVMGL